MIWRTVHLLGAAKLGAMRVLVVDNYDSFVYNLVQYLAQLGADCTVWRNDVVDVEKLSEFDAVLVSPGPGTPERAGQSMDVVRKCAEERIPMLGVCLGHQALGVVFGATVDRAPELLHGKTSQVRHTGVGVLAGLPEEFTATRYHSLTVLPETIDEAVFKITGRTDSGIVMGMRHRELPLEGVQFHPESVLTQGGHRMLANWMASAGHPVSDATVEELEQATRALQKAAVA